MHTIKRFFACSLAAGALLIVASVMHATIFGPPDPINIFNTRSVLIGVKRLYEMREKLLSLRAELAQTKSDSRKKELIQEQEAMLERFSQLLGAFQEGAVVNTSSRAVRLARMQQALPIYFQSRDALKAVLTEQQQAKTSAERAAFQPQIDALTSAITRAEWQFRLTVLSSIDWKKPLPPVTPEQIKRAQEFIARFQARHQK